MTGLVVRGRPTAEELAAVLAVVARVHVTPAEDPLARWRRGRQAVIKPT